jgi:hypothetical protein
VVGTLHGRICSQHDFKILREINKQKVFKMKTLFIPFHFQTHCLEKHYFIKKSGRVLQKAS